MKLTMKKEVSTLTVAIEGSIDTVTAPELEKQLGENWDGISNLILDFSAVDYISSAGLRVMITADQHMEKANGKMTIRHASDDVKEVFEMTGFDELLDME